MPVEYYINEINNMLFSTYVHGGDLGGPYGSEEAWVQTSIEDFLKKTNLDKNYFYGTINRTTEDFEYIKVPQIIKKNTLESNTLESNTPKSIDYSWE